MRPLLMALGWGAASALALPPLHGLPILLLALPALLGLLENAGSWRRAGLLGGAFFWAHHTAGLYWVTHALFTDIGQWFWLVPFAAPGIGLPLAIFGLIPTLAAWHAAPGWRRIFAFSAAWVLAEMLRGVMFTGFPWNLLGTVWAFHPLPLQPASVIGVHGLSLLTVFLACLPALRDWRWLAAGGAVLACWIGFGAWRLAQPEPPHQGVRLVLVQANVAQDLKWRQDQRMPIFQRYLALTELGTLATRAAHPDVPVLAIWPETASPFLLAQDAEARRLAAAALAPGAQLLAGSMRAEWGPDGRLSRVFNSLVGVNDAAEVTAVYDKWHLVPFGEYMPLGGLIPIRMVVGGMDFSAGSGMTSLSLHGIGNFSPLICYEVIFPGRVTGRERPQWLLNVTNDAWFGFSAGPFQHLASARLRAVEEGLPMVRAAQTGISVIYDPYGREVARIDLGRTGTVADWLPGALAATPYARYGITLNCIVLLLVAGIGAMPHRRLQESRFRDSSQK
ncbi:MAG: apolipoprotein N-acyltransferase [Alphaproteobacteria bacterium]|nr:apolipoprotein N-acyltransferase [Alphaproteobacteria bacterium]